MDTHKKSSLCQKSFNKNVPMCCLLRETGYIKQTGGPSKGLQFAAEERLILKNHEEYECNLPDGTRSTFLMVFSPDGKMVASTHGNHNVYVTDFTNGRNVKILTGHPRTPWCIAFHPSSNQILASGCLGGQVRVWDLHGGSEIWTAESQTVIASLAFHPTDRVLVIASYNELHFWDWSQQKPFAKCCTANEREKVRYVAFDDEGEKLVTGIANAAPRPTSQWDRVSAPQPPPQLSQLEHERRITICYRYMVEQYEQLLDRYYRLQRETNGSGGSTPGSATNGIGSWVESIGARGGGRQSGGSIDGRGTGGGWRENRRTSPSLNALSRRSPASTIDRGTDPMESMEEPANRCSMCRRTNLSSDENEPGPSTSTNLNHRHSTGTDEISASHSSSQFMVERSDDTTPQVPLYLRSNYLFERLGRLRAQVETGRAILARTRTAAAAMSARMSPSAPEDANFLIDRSPPDRLPTETGRAQETSPPSRFGHLLMLPEPLMPDLPLEDTPSLISRMWLNLSRRRYGNRASDSSSSDTSLSDSVPTWQRPLTPPPSSSSSSPSGSSRITNLSDPVPIRSVMYGYRPPMSSSIATGRSFSTVRNARESSETSLSDLVPTLEEALSPPLSFSSSGSSRLTNLNSSASNRRVTYDNVPMNSSAPNRRGFTAVCQQIPRRYFRDSGSNTEPPSESNSSDSASSNIRRSAESSSAIARLRAQFRRLQSVYNSRADREPHLLREAADDAERRLLSRFANLLERPFPSTSSSPESGLQVPQGNFSDLASVRFGLDILGRHIENLSNQCTRVRLEVGEMRRMWDELESQIFTLHSAIRDWPPVVRVSPGNQVDTEGVASTSSLPTDEESEDSYHLTNFGRRLRSLRGPRRFRFLHRPAYAYKRPRIDRHFRLRRRNQQGTSPDEDDTDENDDEEATNTNRQSENSDADSRGLKRKAMSDPIPPSSLPPSCPFESPRGNNRSSFARVRAMNRLRSRGLLIRDPLLTSNSRDSRSGGGRDGQDDSGSSRTRGTPASSRETIRNRARHVLLLMVDSLTQFFENDTFTRTVNSNENLRERITNLTSLLELALNLTDLLLTQLDLSSRETGNRDRRPSSNWHQPSPREENFRPYRRPTVQLRRVNVDDLVYSVIPRDDSLPSTTASQPSLPVLRVNDGPVPPESSSSTLPESPPPPNLPPPLYRVRPSLLNARRMYHSGNYSFVDDSSEDSSHDRHDIFYRAQASGVFIHDTPLAPHHRIQAWDFSKYKLPEIHIADKNIVVAESKVHNDASVDISKDSKLLVTLLPSRRLCITTMIGVYSLQWETLGQCLYTTGFDMNAVSVSLSPTSRHLLVGLAARRVHFIHTDKQTFAQIFRLEGGKPSKSSTDKGRLVLVKELETSREMSTDYMSLNCIRWSPTPGEALVYGTNTGKLKILR